MPTGTSTIDLVRLTVPPSWMFLSSPKMTMPTLSVSRLSARPRVPSSKVDQLAGLDLVEAVDAGDAVADREDATDLGHLGLGAEIRDLLLEDGGDFGRTDVHQRTPLIDNSRFCSLVFKEASIMREPIRTTSPPISAGSTLALSCTGRPA